jgi:protoporphyrinogen oxidase
MGMNVAYQLARQGVSVEVFEASDRIGGLAGRLDLFDGTKVDRFCHMIPSRDAHLLELCEALGLSKKLRFRQVRTGILHQGIIYGINNFPDYLRYPLLTWSDRLRLGLILAWPQRGQVWRDHEGGSAREWLRRWSGNRAYERFWKPMLRAKFGKAFEDIQATYVLSRMSHLKPTGMRLRHQVQAGYLEGGFDRIFQVMRAKIESAGGGLHTTSTVDEVLLDRGEAWGLRIKDHAHPFDAVVSTLSPGSAWRLLPEAPRDFRARLTEGDHLGIVSTLLVLDRPLTGFWSLYLADPNIPFTEIIETTTYLDPSWVGGHHLVYLRNVVSKNSPWLGSTDEEIQDESLHSVQSMFPGFDQDLIREIHVQRKRYIEPIPSPRSRTSPLVPIESQLARLYFATSLQMSPEPPHGESLTRFASTVAEIVHRTGLRRGRRRTSPALSHFPNQPYLS